MKKSPVIPQVTIYQQARFSYFQWFILGFYRLQRKGRIHLSIRSGLLYYLERIAPFEIVAKFWSGFFEKKKKNNPYLLKGVVKFGEKEILFVIDSADSPFLFDGESLKKCDVYFKMQCPLDLSRESFALSSSITIPWLDHQHEDPLLPVNRTGPRKPLGQVFFENRHKIQPLMVGPRRLSWGQSFRAMEKGYQSFIGAFSNEKSPKLMCYFGASKGPNASEKTSGFDLDREADLVKAFATKIHHPNEKRARASELIKQFVPLSDARIVADQLQGKGDDRLFIPLCDFPKHVARAEYNLNISGFRLSIPNRFLDSFAVGTGIVTDKLSCRWYLPFEPFEVRETIPMGYEILDKGDWDAFVRDITSLPMVNSMRIREAFLKKWSPEVVAQYMINACMED